jgi:S1-C subfamily serine protease
MRTAALFGLSLALTAALFAREEEKPVVLPPYRVDAPLASVTMQVKYFARGSDEPRIDAVLIDGVKSDSRAARAGLAIGMEILAIQDDKLAGLTQEEFAKVMSRPLRDPFRLTVRRTRNSRPLTIALPLRVETAPVHPKAAAPAP